MKKILYTTGFIISLVIAIVFERQYLNSTKRDINLTKFQKIFQEKEQYAQNLLNQVGEQIKNENNFTLTGILFIIVLCFPNSIYQFRFGYE